MIEKTSQQLPVAPKFSLKKIGPGLVLIAMGLGSGEFILWPKLVSTHGMGILWGALLGITLQFIITAEVARYTIATGNSIFIGLKKIFRWIPIWFVISTFMSFAWPGIIGTSGDILAQILGITDSRLITIPMLIGIGCLLTFGGKVYTTLNRFQKIFIAITLPVIILISLQYINADRVVAVVGGLIGSGEGYYFIPFGISIATFLGAVAYSGAGGNLVLSHSFYVQDAGYGMSGHNDSQIHLKKHTSLHKGTGLFELEKPQLHRFGQWMKYVYQEQFITFWLIGLVTILLLALIAYGLVYPLNGCTDLDFLKLQAMRLGPEVGTFFLLSGVVFLFKTQLGVFEATSRIMTENVQLFGERFSNFSRAKLFFFFLWAQIIFGIVISLLQFATPFQVLLLNSVFSAISMLVLAIAMFIFSNSKHLPVEIQPNSIVKTIMAGGSLFFLVLFGVTIFSLGQPEQKPAAVCPVAFEIDYRQLQLQNLQPTLTAIHRFE